MITTTIKSYFLVIVALSSIAGSALAAPYISNVATIGSSGSSGSSSVIPDASAQSVPYRVDHHLKIKEKVGDPVRIEENINDGEQHCEMSCKYIEYRPGSRGRAALAFIADAPADLSGAKRVHFFLMGENGGETVKVKIAGKNPPTDRGNTANTTRGPAQNGDNLLKENFGVSSNVITLPNDWQRFEVPLDGVDLKNIVAPFGIELLKGKGSAPQVVYLKYIVYDNQPADERFLLPANATAANATAANATAANATAANATAANATAANATAANATAANATAVESDNNTIEQGDENIEENNNTSNTTIPDTLEVENDVSDNTGNETIPSSTPINSSVDSAAPTSSDQTSNSTDIAPAQAPVNENLPPVAMVAVDSLTANPGDNVILDGSASSDPDGNEITYLWSQSDGPTVDIINANTATPTVTIPTMERDDTIAIDLVVSDGQTESNRASVVIDIQYLEEIEDAIQQDLLPEDNVAAQGWSDAACGSNTGLIECLTDGSQSSFVSSDRPSGTTDLLFSFQDPSAAGINGTSNSIAYVTAQVTAKKTGASGFTSLIVDDPNSNQHYSTPSISIASDSFEQYSFTWTDNPATGEPWTVDSLNSFVAGYRYLAGQGSIQISEFKLIVGSVITQVEEEPIPPSSAIDEESTAAEEPEAPAAVDESGGDDNSGEAPEEEAAAPNDGDEDGDSSEEAPEEEEAAAPNADDPPTDESDSPEDEG
jgi:K319-like protein